MHRAKQRVGPKHVGHADGQPLALNHLLQGVDAVQARTEWFLDKEVHASFAQANGNGNVQWRGCGDDGRIEAAGALKCSVEGGIALDVVSLGDGRPQGFVRLAEG